MQGDISKQYSIFSLSKLDLIHSFGFDPRQVNALTEEEMWEIVDSLRKTTSYVIPVMRGKVRNITQEVVRRKRFAFFWGRR